MTNQSSAIAANNSAAYNPLPSSSTSSVATTSAATAAAPPKKSRVLRRKTDHSVIERRRREKINERLIQLQCTVPACQKECQDLFDRRFEASAATRPAAIASKRTTTAKRPSAAEKLERQKEEMLEKMRTTMVLEKLCIISHTVNYVFELRKEIEQLKSRSNAERIAVSAASAPAETDGRLDQNMAAHYRDVHTRLHHSPAETLTQPLERDRSHGQVDTSQVARQRSISVSSTSSSALSTPPQSPCDPCSSQSKRIEAIADLFLNQGRDATSTHYEIEPVCAQALKKRRLHWGSDQLRSTAAKVSKPRKADLLPQVTSAMEQTGHLVEAGCCKDCDAERAEPDAQDRIAADRGARRDDVSHSGAATVRRALAVPEGSSQRRASASAGPSGEGANINDAEAPRKRKFELVNGDKPLSPMFRAVTQTGRSHRPICRLQAPDSCCRDDCGAECRLEAADRSDGLVEASAERHRPSLPPPGQLFPHLCRTHWAAQLESHRHRQPAPHLDLHRPGRLAPPQLPPRESYAATIETVAFRPLAMYSNGAAPLTRTRYHASQNYG